MGENGHSKIGGSSLSSREWDLNESFKLAIRSLLTSCSNQDFTNAFSTFTPVEQGRLHRLFIEVIASLHKTIEDEFESLSLELQVGTTLDAVEHLVEEQRLDPLTSKKTNVMDTTRNVLTVKENEVTFLAHMLEQAEEQNQLMGERIELLKRGREEDVSGVADAFKMLRSSIVEYGTSRNLYK